ncbi:hypothetical protein D3C85_1628380 [compost metagenome]
MAPLSALRPLPVTSPMIARAWLFNCGFFIAWPPMAETPLAMLLLKTTPFASTLNSLNLLCEMPRWFGSTMFTSGVPLAVWFMAARWAAA